MAPLPGNPELPADLPARFLAALAARGPGHQPRTHHLEGDGRPRFVNRLVLETSPYLLQHAHNPVNWYPWGDEAFADARRTGRPVFLSIGYSTCHWCHVMEGESFEDQEIAEYLNGHYVCVKVDREQRPDVDAIYMSAVQTLSGHGGWPMSVFLTPDREPFFAGTYFPPRDGVRGAGLGFLTILRQLRRTYDEDPARVREAASSITLAIRRSMQGDAARDGQQAPDPAWIASTVDFFARSADRVHGGLRRAPKFPSNVPVRLLLRYHRRTGDAQALQLATLTLEKMAAGGMYDQLAGGFHRYSTDERWLVPHFEKMLYDNALLAVSYSEAHQVTGRADFARVAREICDYVLREMTSPDGGFYSATDADSEGEEGKFFVWSRGSVDQLLGPRAQRFARHYDVSAAGNWEGTNILNVPAPDEAEHAALAVDRKTLYDARAQRPAPLRDDKILAAWNGLMISGLAVAGRVLAEPRYVLAAARAADHLLQRMRQGGRILRSHTDGRTQPQGFLEDQAFVTAGLIDLYEASFDPRWLGEAVALAEALEIHFADTEAGGWFMTAADAEVLLAREKPQYDGAEPSGTAVALLNALRLHAFTGQDRWRVVADRAFSSIAGILAERPMAMTEALLAVDFATDVPREVLLVWPAGAEPGALLDVVRTTFLPNRALAGVVEGPPLDALGQMAPFVLGRVAQGGRATAYVCEHGACELPTSDLDTFRQQLARVNPYTIAARAK